jgi:hypothetical protein
MERVVEMEIIMVSIDQRENFKGTHPVFGAQREKGLLELIAFLRTLPVVFFTTMKFIVFEVTMLRLQKNVKK